VTLSSLFVSLLAVLGLYALAMSRVTDPPPPAQQRWQLASFTLGLLAALVVFIPSPDRLGPDHRFTVNMGQMLLAVDLAPLLLFLGLPGVMLQRRRGWEDMGRRLAAPLVAGTLSSAILFGWFVPVLFEAASRDLALWLVKQALFVVAGLVVWWPVACPLPAWRPAPPARILYLFVMRVPMVILGAMITFADQLIYSSRSFALEICAPSSLTDQQAGGVVMWTVSGLVLFVAFTVVFVRWLGAPDVAES
jgi:cytochrome c oxidase assembly factor CtaG